MKTHPIIDYPYRWVPVLVVALVLVLAQVMIMSVYTGADYVPAVIDGIATIGWLMALGYLVWFVVGVVSIFQTEVITLVAGILPVYPISLLRLPSLFVCCLAFRPGLPFFFGIV